MCNNIIGCILCISQNFASSIAAGLSWKVKVWTFVNLCDSYTPGAEREHPMIDACKGASR